MQCNATPGCKRRGQGLAKEVPSGHKSEEAQQLCGAASWNGAYLAELPPEPNHLPLKQLQGSVRPGRIVVVCVGDVSILGLAHDLRNAIPFYYLFGVAI